MKRNRLFVFALSLIIAVSLTFTPVFSHAQPEPKIGKWAGITSKPEITVGDRGYGTTFANAVTVIGSTEATLILPPGSHVGGGVTIPSTLSLKVLKGALITVANATTFTVNGPFDAGLYPVFSVSGTAKIAWGNGAVRALFPQWWGATADGVTDDTTALLSLVSSLPAVQGITIDFGMRGQYYLTDTIDFGTVVAGLKLTSSGWGWGGSTPNVKLVWGGAAGKPILKFADTISNLEIEHLGFNGADIAVQLTRVTDASLLAHENYIRRCTFDNQAVASIVFGYLLTDAYTAGNDDFDGMNVDDCYFGNSPLGILANCKNNSYNLRSYRNTFGSGMDQCIKIKNVFNIDIDKTMPLNADWDTGSLYAVHIIAGGNTLNFSNAYTESPRLLLIDNWSGNATDAMLLQNVCINNNGGSGLTAIDINGAPATLLNVMASTQGAPYISRTIRLRSGGRIHDLNVNDTLTDDLGTVIWSRYGRTYELGRSVPIGDAIPVTFNAGNFTAKGAMTWTVAEADQIHFYYTLNGKIMTVFFYLSATTVGGVADNGLYITIPGSKTANRDSICGGVWLLDNNVASDGVAIIDVDASIIQIFRSDIGNFSASTNATLVAGQISFEIN